MTCWSKTELESLLEDVINELDLSAEMIAVHGQHGASPSELVRMVLDSKDAEIDRLKQYADEPYPHWHSIKHSQWSNKNGQTS